MAARRPRPLVAPVMTMVGGVRMGQIRATVERAAAGAGECWMDMATETRSSVTFGLHQDIVGNYKLYTCDGEISTTLTKRAPAEPHRSTRRKLELALGAELNALLSAARPLYVQTPSAIHPDLQPAAFHLARWLYAYGPVQPTALAHAVGMDRT